MQKLERLIFFVKKNQNNALHMFEPYEYRDSDYW